MTQAAPMRNWFGDSLLKAHVMYVSPAWVKDRGTQFDAEKLVELLCSAYIGALELYCKDIHGFAYYPAVPELGPSYPRDVVGETQAACRQRGVKFIAYYSIGWDTLAARNQPDWVMRTADGSIPFSEFQARLQLPWLCINTGYRTFALDRIRHLFETYQPDGLFIDIFMDNIPAACYCASCEWSFAELNGRSIPRSFEQPEDVIAIRTFQADSYHVFLRDIRTIVSSRPGALLTYNFVGGISAHAQRFSDLVDWHEVEAHAPDYLLQSRTSKILRKLGKPFEIMSPGCTKSIREGGSAVLDVMGDWMSMVPKPEVAMRLEAAVALAHGGTLTLSVNPRPDGSIEEADLQPVLRLGRWIEERRGRFESAEALSDVAILWNEESFAAASLDITDRVELLSGDKSMQGLHAALVASHVQFDMVQLKAADLDDYAVSVLPESMVVSESGAAALRGYVERGGNLIVLYRASLNDGLGRDMEDFALADVMGVEYAGMADVETFYVRATDPRIGEHLLDISMLMRGQLLSVRPTSASVLASYALEIAKRTDTTYVWPTQYNPPGPVSKSAAVTLNKFGKGTCIYVGFPLATNVARRGVLDPTPGQLLGNVVASALERPIVRTNAPRMVEVVVNRKAAGVVVIHLINYYAGLEGYYSRNDALPGIGELYVELDSSRMPDPYEVLINGERAKTTSVTDEQWLRIGLPLLQDHVVVEIRPPT